MIQYTITSPDSPCMALCTDTSAKTLCKHCWSCRPLRLWTWRGRPAGLRSLCFQSECWHGTIISIRHWAGPDQDQTRWCLSIFPWADERCGAVMNVPPQTAGAATGPAQSSLLINGFNYPSPLPDLTDTLQDLKERKLTDLTVTLEDPQSWCGEMLSSHSRGEMSG